jgi:hypothetical protein
MAQFGRRLTQTRGRAPRQRGQQMERRHDEADRPCLCVDVGVIRTGYATRTPPPAGQYVITVRTGCGAGMHMVNGYVH